MEELLSQGGRTESAPEQPVAGDSSRSELAGEGEMPRADVEYLFSQAQEALDSIESPSDGQGQADVREFQFPEFGGATANSETATLDLIRDVELDLKIELGRTHMYLEDVLKLRKGSVVPLDKLAGDPVDIYVNGRLIARGEVLVLNDNFCVRVAELIAGAGGNS
jgi:flagellar motor switch protein FliN/FliY